MSDINKNDSSIEDRSPSDERDSLSKQVSLRKIIVSVLEDNNVSKEKSYSFEADIKRVRRGFEKLVEKLGGDVNNLKDGKNFEFDESSVPFMKVLLNNIYKEKGIIADFLNDKESTKNFSSAKVHYLIQQIIDDSEKAGYDEKNLKDLAIFLSTIFLESPLRSIEYCHLAIDILAENLADLSYSKQRVYWLGLETRLGKEVSLRLIDMARNMQEIASVIQISKESQNDIGIQDYNLEGLSSQDMMEYRSRDEQVLDRIRKDKYLRAFIENSLGEKAEQIFNYAASKNKSDDK